MNELSMPKQASSIISVIGVGGAGGNAVNHMWNTGIKGVNFLICNTDQKAMDNSPVKDKIRLGKDGLGAGNDPERGREAAMESLEQIKQYIESSGTRMVFVTAGMGGGTGTGASPVIAKLAHELGLLTVAIVTSPLVIEGPVVSRQHAVLRRLRSMPTRFWLSTTIAFARCMASSRFHRHSARPTTFWLWPQRVLPSLSPSRAHM